MFVLNSKQQLTDQETQYLKQYIKGNVETVFYLINYWDLLEKEEDEEEVRQIFVERLSEALEIEENEVQEMWGKRIFEISAKNDWKIIENYKSLQGTTCEKFWVELQLFLLSNRLSSELNDAFKTAKRICQAITDIVKYRLYTIDNTLTELNEKVKTCQPHFREMKDIIKKLTEKVNEKKKALAKQTTDSYEKHYQGICSNFEEEFSLPEVKSLEKQGIEDFKTKLEQKFTEYLEDKNNGWENETEKLFKSEFELLENTFELLIIKYQDAKNQIKDILQGNEKTIKIPGRPTEGINEHPNLSPNINIEPPGSKKRYLFGGGLVSAAVGGGGGVGLLAFLKIGLIAAGVLTPAGWGMIAITTISGLIGAFVTDGTFKRKQFQDNAKNELKNLLNNMNNQQQHNTIKNQVYSLFAGYSSTINDLDSDIIALQESLNSLIKQKENSEIDCESEKNILNDFVRNISDQVDEIESDFQKYLFYQDR